MDSRPASGRGPRRGRQTVPYDRRYYTEISRTEVVRKYGAHWWSNRFFAKRVVKALARVGGRRVLELGCAHGHVLARLEGRAETYGVDLSAHAIAHARRNCPHSVTRVADVETGLRDMFGGQLFDVIFAKSLFEHLARPEEAVATCWSLLRGGGLLLFSVPSTTNILRPLKGADWIGSRDPTHVSLLTPPQWTRLLGGQGFAVERSYSTGFWDVPYVPLIPKALQLPIFGGLTAAALLTSGGFVPPCLGENLIVEARRSGS